MKKKNTGSIESNQGHRANMNSSDRSWFPEENAEGWTTVVSKSSKRLLRKKQKVEDNLEGRRAASKSGDRVRTRSRSASSAASHGQRDAADEGRVDEVASQQGFGSEEEQEDVLAREEQESAQDSMAHEGAGDGDIRSSASAGAKDKKGKRARSPPPQPEHKVVQETPPPDRHQPDLQAIECLYFRWRKQGSGKHPALAGPALETRRRGDSRRRTAFWRNSL